MTFPFKTKMTEGHLDNELEGDLKILKTKYDTSRDELVIIDAEIEDIQLV